MLRGSDGWMVAPSAEFKKEGEFQLIVQDTFAQVLAGQTEVPAVVAREVVTPEGGRIDVVSVDADGLISVCECKLDRNASSRREVLGQVLEYGGSLHGMPVDDFLARMNDALRRRDSSARDVEEQLAAQAAGDWTPEAWREKVADALQRGHFRLIVAVDGLTDVLKQTVIFLNDRAAFPLVVADLRRLRVGGHEVLMPRLFGEEAVARKLPQKRSAAPTVRDPDTVIVPAGEALNEFERLRAYICQPERSFRDVQYMGFYSQRTVDPRFPAIVDRRKNVAFTEDQVTRLRALGDLDASFAHVIDVALKEDLRTEGERYQIFLLDLERGFTLAQPITHPIEVGRSAWVQNQRYSRRDALESTPQPATTAELAEAGG